MTTSPRPTTRMGKVAIVCRPARSEMVDQLLPRPTIEAVQILVRKSAQPQLGLIEPTGMGRSEKDSQARMRGEVRVGVLVNMRRTVVQNQMNPPGRAVAACHLAH